MSPTAINSFASPRFSLRMIFVLLSIFCIIFGWWGNKAARQKNAVELVFLKNGNVVYTFNRRPNNQPPPPPQWMMAPSVCDYFFDVIGIGVQEDSEFGEGDLEILRDLPDITDLHFAGSRFTDSAIKYIVRIRKLRYLALVNTSVSDKGLARLAAHTGLREIALYNNATTCIGVTELQMALPHCRISD